MSIAIPGLLVTAQNADGMTDNNATTDLRDSDATPAGQVVFTLGGIGANNHTLDIGYKALPASLLLGNYVWYDQNMDGIQDSNASGVGGVGVALYNNATCAGVSAVTTTTSQIGWYGFTGLAAGDYCLRFTAPEGWALSPQKAGDLNLVGFCLEKPDADPAVGDIFTLNGADR